MKSIQIRGVSKRYPNGVFAIDDVDLHIAEGEFMVLVGPSGCGKSTLLRTIAGLEDVSAGSIHIGGRDVTELEPRARDIAMVFQNYALYAHMSVRENIGFGLRLRRTPREDIRRRVDDVARVLGLETLLERKPGQLSGGQRQRVAMGRAIVREPQAFLMDEPLSNLDAKLRVQMRAELARLHERLGVTTVYVTHDQVEAMTLGTRVAVLRDGRLQQCDAPEILFYRPANVFVAAFMGSPPMNLARARWQDGRLRFGQLSLSPAPAGMPSLADGEEVVIGIRPNALMLAGPHADPRLPRISVTAEIVERLGSEVQVHFAVEGAETGERDAQEGRLLSDAGVLFAAALDGGATVRAGDRIELVVDTGGMSFFDIETSLRIETTR
jgi:multiple sugar transport system ATP-binding protein